MDALPLYLVVGALGIIVVIDTVVLLGLVRMTTRMQHLLSVLTPVGAGQDAPEWNGVDLDGESVAGRQYSGQLRVLLFVSPDCSACSTTLNELKLLNYRSRGNVVAICQGDAAQCRPLLDPYLAVLRVILDETGQISAQFDVKRFPTAVMIDGEDKIRSYGHPERDDVDAAMNEQCSEGSPALA